MQKAENRGQSTALTSGCIKKQLVLFSIPIFLGTLLQQLYNVIDAVVAGRLVNEDTILKNFPLFCPKCKHENLINVSNLQVTVITEPDAKPQSR